jgi:CubicO group peptidase (beta-lactamase class C family)
MDDPRIEQALARALELGEAGIQVAAYVGEELIVDACAGTADGSGRPVQPDTLFPVFSVSKVATAVAVHIQAERNLISYDAPVARYWPEFAANGKDGITIAHVLAHQSGIPQMPGGVTPELMCDWDWMTAQIEGFMPYFQPGTRNAYQSLIFGWILGELVRRTDPAHRQFGEFVRDEVCAPLKMGDFWLGLPAAEIGRVAVLISDFSHAPMIDESPESKAAKPDAVALDAPVHNRHDIWQACLPATGGIMSARDGVRLFAMLANLGELDGVRLLSRQRVLSFTTPRPNAADLDLVMVGGGRAAPPVGIGGLWLDGTVFGGGPAVLCHTGAGGSAGYADTGSGLSAVICHNRLFEGDGPAGINPHAALVSAIREVAAPYLEARRAGLLAGRPFAYDSESRLATTSSGRMREAPEVSPRSAGKMIAGRAKVPPSADWMDWPVM